MDKEHIWTIVRNYLKNVVDHKLASVNIDMYIVVEHFLIHFQCQYMYVYVVVEYVFH